MKQKTCRYCSSNLSYIGEYKEDIFFYCDFCELSFTLEETSQNRQRKKFVPEYYETNYYISTKDIMKKNSIELFFLLKECRKDWYLIKQTLETINQNANEETMEHPSIKAVHEEYETLTKKKFVIENVLLEKAGFVPDKLTEDFLNELVYFSEQASKKRMNIYIKESKPVSI